MSRQIIIRKKSRGKAGAKSLAASTRLPAESESHDLEGDPSLQAAAELRQAGRFAQAEKHYRALLGANPRNAAALDGLGLSNLDRGRRKAALACFRRAAASQPSNIGRLKRLGKALISNNLLDEAEKIFVHIIRLKPDESRAYFSLSAIRHGRDKAVEAREILCRGVKQRPFTIRPCRRRPLARLLRFRGVQKGYYTIGVDQGNHYITKLRGGNFSDKHLIDRDKFTTVNFFILDDNLLACRDIPDYDLVVNSIADPDVEGRSLQTLTEFLAANDRVPIINRPERVAETARDNNFRRFHKLSGILFPRTLRLILDQKTIPHPSRWMEEKAMTYPVLLRETGRHTGRSFVKADNAEQVKSYLEERRGREIYATQFVENFCRDSYFRKLRVFFIDGKIYPVVCHIDTLWNVHGANRKKNMSQNDWMMEEEKSFMASVRTYLGEPAYKALEGLNDLVGLDFFGVDFDLTEDGQLLIFELNPVMRHSYEHAQTFSYLRPHMRNISAAFDAMIVDRLG